MQKEGHFISNVPNIEWKLNSIIQSSKCGYLVKCTKKEDFNKGFLINMHGVFHIIKLNENKQSIDAFNFCYALTDILIRSFAFGGKHEDKESVVYASFDEQSRMYMILMRLCDFFKKILSQERTVTAIRMAFDDLFF